MLIRYLPEVSKQKLIDSGFNENKTINEHQEVRTYMLGYYNMTPLTYAAKIGDRELVEELLKHKAEIDLRDDSYELTPLMWAAWFGRKKITSCLLSYGANSTLKGRLPSHPGELSAYGMTKAHSYCSFTGLWYSAQKYVGEGDIDKTRKTLRYNR